MCSGPSRGVVANRETEAGGLRVAGGVDDRLDDRGDEVVDDGLERATDDDRDGQLDDVAPKDEVLEALEHLTVFP